MEKAPSVHSTGGITAQSRSRERLDVLVTRRQYTWNDGVLDVDKSLCWRNLKSLCVLLKLSEKANEKIK